MTAATDATRRIRPADRKQRIEAAAALAFARLGYHAVGMQDIAAAVGISAPALYRHFPNKYALFARTTFALAHRLVAATDAAASAPMAGADDARGVLAALLDAVIDTTVELRATGGTYRWEGRYLERADRDLLTAEFRRLRERFEAAHRVYRPDVPEGDRTLLVLAALSVVASITAHRTVVAGRSLRALLRDAAWRSLDADLPGTEGVGAPPAPGRREAPAAAVPPVRADVPAPGRRAALVDAAIPLFAERGYNEVSIEDIAAAVELTPSGVYRHVEGKSALLLAACDKAAVELERAALRARESATDAADALRRLCRAYVDHTFAHLALTRVYFAELGNLAPEEQRRVRALQRAHIADWAALLEAVHPELGGREATILVHAGLGVVTDQVPLLHTRGVAEAVRLAHLVERVLGIG